VQPASEGVAAATVLAACAVLTQIAYPLLAGEALRGATILAVVLFAAASVLHAGAVLGPRAAAGLLAGAAGTGLVAEAVGVATGVPFGTYSYAGTLGREVLGVPLLVPLAWTMMAYPALLLGRRLGAAARPGRWRPLVTAVLGGATLAGWDLFLDPQMVAAGHWSWAYPEPGLPGVPQVPLTNAAGWVLVGTVMTALLDRVLPRTAGAGARVPDPRTETLPAALLGWTWLGSVVANLAFFGRPWVALYGGVALGLLVLPYLRALVLAVRAAPAPPAAAGGSAGPAGPAGPVPA
jgi:putative membrane protein